MPEIRILVSEAGEVKLDMAGYRGEACLSDLEPLLEKLRSAGIDIAKQDLRKKAEEEAVELESV